MSAQINPYLRKQPWCSRGKGLNGRPLCYCGCGIEIPADGRRRTSIPGHYEAWREHSDADYIRRKVGERDRGVCALCLVDTAVKSRVAKQTERLLRWLARRHADDLFFAGQLPMYMGHTEAERRYAAYRRETEGGRVRILRRPQVGRILGCLRHARAVRKNLRRARAHMGG